MIGFVTNLPEGLRSGGFSGMNAAAHSALAKTWPVHYTGPINPKVPLLSRIGSSLSGRLGRKRSFSFFSERRLQRIAADYLRLASPSAELVFFHGFTPWIRTRPDRPYMAWSDCTFDDYVRIYHDPSAFDSGDLDRIREAEGEWLRRAESVLFTSRWAAERAESAYGLSASRIIVVGQCGEIQPPESDAWSGDRSFLFVSTHFAAKGGRTVLAAFQEVRKSHPESRLTIVGDSPATDDVADGVAIAGYLRKEDPAQTARFRDLLASSFALVHPTRSDILPLIVIEAGYFGSPVITSRRFAIPEIVAEGDNGYLLDDPADVSALVAAMRRLLEMPAESYQMLRRRAWERSWGEYSRERFESRLCEAVAQHLPKR